jgi:hypothetical protein
VSDAAWPPKSGVLGRVISENEAAEVKGQGARYAPSGTAASTHMPFRPASSNPLKTLEQEDWNLYVIDLVSCLQSVRRELTV